jgi:hypothetical protein
MTTRIASFQPPLPNYGYSNRVKSSTPLFGAETEPPSDAKPAAGTADEVLGNPKKLPLFQRLTSFLSIGNLKAGFNDAREAFSNSKKGLELLGLSLELVLAACSWGLTLAPNLLWPGLTMSKTLTAFFQGVHNAEAKRREAADVAEEPPPPEPKAADA